MHPIRDDESRYIYWKKDMKIIVLLILGSLLAFGANASGWTGKVKITGVFVLNENTALLRLSSFNNPDGCDVDKGHIGDAGHVSFNPSLNKSWYSLALTAYASGKDVNIYVSGPCHVVWSDSSYSPVGHMRSY
jgi:hypothetical protein